MIQTQYHGDEFLEPKEALVGQFGVDKINDVHKTPDELAQQRRHDEDRLAEDIVEECRVQLMLKFRFLDRALWRMDLVPVRSGLSWPIATDGKNIYYDPQRIIARFNGSFDESVRDYLHMVMHCIFRHPWDKRHKSSEAWNLACDIVAESVALDLCATRFPSEQDQDRKNVIDQLALFAGSIVPSRLYDFLNAVISLPQGNTIDGIGRPEINEWHQLFERDDHSVWPAYQDARSDEYDQSDEAEEMIEDDADPDVQHDGFNAETLGNDESGEEESRSLPDGAESQEDDGDEEAADDSTQDTGSIEGNSDEVDEGDSERDKKDWEELAKEIEMNLETFSKEWGTEAGTLVANLAIANRPTFDYTDFLRKFMVASEQIKLNPEEFDYNYYTFGMDMYGNMPFIEPLEYKESNVVRDFVIVIDTSESVSGPLVQRFLDHTFSIMKESEDFATDVNIHIIQSDSKVQSDLLITDVRDIERVIGNFAIRGFGGTDFRPAFDYISMLRARGELTDLRGLIYFTDGYGTFPERPPDYDAAFVFIDDGTRELPPVPPWAMRLTIDEHQIERLGR